MKQYVVGIAEMFVTGDVNAKVVTYSLGSCIGLAIYDPEAKVGGILHYMLPDSRIDSEKARGKPSMFADTGIPYLFKSAYKLGLEKKRARVIVAGGAQILDDSGTFTIGKKNQAALRKMFWKNKVLVDGEDTGGTVSRTLSLEIGTGDAWVKSGGILKPI